MKSYFQEFKNCSANKQIDSDEIRSFNKSHFQASGSKSSLQQVTSQLNNIFQKYRLTKHYMGQSIVMTTSQHTNIPLQCVLSILLDGGLVTLALSYPLRLKHRYQRQLLIHLINYLNLSADLAFLVSVESDYSTPRVLIFTFTLFEPNVDLLSYKETGVEQSPAFRKIVTITTNVYHKLNGMVQDHGIRESIYPKGSELIEKIEEEEIDLIPQLMIELVHQKDLPLASGSHQASWKKEECKGGGEEWKKTTNQTKYQMLQQMGRLGAKDPSFP